MINVSPVLPEQFQILEKEGKKHGSSVLGPQNVLIIELLVDIIDMMMANVMVTLNFLFMQIYSSLCFVLK